MQSTAIVVERPRTAFISGPIEPDEQYFNTHYVPRIRTAIAAGDSFVMGPAPGMDTMALNFLINEGVDPDRITVYVTAHEARMGALVARVERLVPNIMIVGETTSERDEAMTEDSDYDILRYMTLDEQRAFYGARYYPRVSATERNERRRLGLPLHVNHGLAEWKQQRELQKSVVEKERSVWSSLKSILRKGP